MWDVRYVNTYLLSHLLTKNCKKNQLIQLNMLSKLQKKIVIIMRPVFSSHSLTSGFLKDVVFLFKEP